MLAVQYHQGRFPPTRLDLQQLLPLVGPANAELARYDGVLAAVPNASVLLSPLTTQEAVLSSRIEGTQATFGEVLEFEAGEEAASEEKKADIYEILNYRSAMHHAVKRMETLPLSQRLMKLEHSEFHHVVTSTHVHMDHENCLEILILRGPGRDIKRLGERLISMRGVKHGRFIPGTTGEKL